MSTVNSTKEGFLATPPNTPMEETMWTPAPPGDSATVPQRYAPRSEGSGPVVARAERSIALRKAQDLGREVADTSRRHPALTLGVGIGIGLGIGFALGRTLR